MVNIAICLTLIDPLFHIILEYTFSVVCMDKIYAQAIDFK